MSDPAATPIPDWARELVGGTDMGAPTLGDCPRRALVVWAGTRSAKKARKAPGERELFLYQARLALIELEYVESPSGHAKALSYRAQAEADARRLGAPYMGVEHLGGRATGPSEARRRGWDRPDW